VTKLKKGGGGVKLGSMSLLAVRPEYVHVKRRGFRQTLLGGSGEVWMKQLFEVYQPGLTMVPAASDIPLQLP